MHRQRTHCDAEMKVKMAIETIKGQQTVSWIVAAPTRLIQIR